MFSSVSPPVEVEGKGAHYYLIFFIFGWNAVFSPRTAPAATGCRVQCCPGPNLPDRAVPGRACFTPPPGRTNRRTLASLVLDSKSWAGPSVDSLTNWRKIWQKVNLRHGSSHAEPLEHGSEGDQSQAPDNRCRWPCITTFKRLHRLDRPCQAPIPGRRLTTRDSLPAC